MRIIAVIIQQKSIMALTCYSITVATYISQYLVSVIVQVFVSVPLPTSTTISGCMIECIYVLRTSSTCRSSMTVSRGHLKLP